MYTNNMDSKVGSVRGQLGRAGVADHRTRLQGECDGGHRLQNRPGHCGLAGRAEQADWRGVNTALSGLAIVPVPIAEHPAVFGPGGEGLSRCNNGLSLL